MNAPNAKLFRSLTTVFVLVTATFFTSIITFCQNSHTPSGLVSQERADSDDILLNITVTDSKGNYVKALPRDAFKIIEGKETREISFFSDLATPTSVGIIFDTSGSLEGIKEKAAQEAMKSFMRAGNLTNEYFLITFGRQPTLLQDWTPDGSEVLDKLASVNAKGATALYDACRLGIEKLKSSGYRKRVLLLISDGEDTSSRFTLKELHRLLKESNVVLYALTISGAYFLPDSLGQTGLTVMDELSSLTGGRTFFPLNLEQAKRDAEIIATELYNQYLISLKPAKAAKNDEWHKIKVKIDLPPQGASDLKGLSIRTREGYYAMAKTP